MSGSNAQWGPSAHIHRVPVIALSQHIYAVIEAFRNIVFRAYGDDRMKDTNDGILSLMEISIAIIGGDIEASVRELLDTLKNNQDNDDDDGSHTEDSDEDEEDETYIIDGCYEQIPEHLRRSVPSSHIQGVHLTTSFLQMGFGTPCHSDHIHTSPRRDPDAPGGLLGSHIRGWLSTRRESVHTQPSHHPILTSARSVHRP